MAQKFYANPRYSFTWPNGAVGYSSSSLFDCLGPFAKVRDCPISGTTVRLTCYATGYADTYFSVPACTRYKGKHVRGYFTTDDSGVKFCVMNSHKHLFPELTEQSK